MEDLSANAASRGRSGVFERSVDRFERTTSAKGAMAATRGSGGSRFGVSGEGDGSADVRHVSMHDVSGSERRELFGFRRTVKATASGIIRAFHTSFDDMEPGSGGGRRFSSGNSIVTNTEAFTETALAAKNEELRALASKNDDLAAEKSDLERVVSAGSKLAPGVAEVMALLSRATEAHAAAHASDTHLSSSHRALLNAALQAQAQLNSLLQEHHDCMGGGGGSAAGGCISAAAGQMRSQQPSSQAQAQTGLMTPAMAAQPSYRAQPPARLRSVSDYAGDGGPRAVTPTDSPGLAPSGMAPSRTLLGTAPPLSHGSSRQAVLPEGRGVAPGDDALTWTSALGVSDVHERLYAENVDRGGPDAAPLVD